MLSCMQKITLLIYCELSYVMWLGMTNAEVLHQVEHGYRMPSPPGCPRALYEIMLECWAKDEMERPTFETLQWKLEEFFVLPASEYSESTMAVRWSTCHVLCIVRPAGDSVADIVQQKSLHRKESATQSVCLCVQIVCQHDNSWTIRDIITTFSGHHSSVESSAVQIVFFISNRMK